MMNEPNHYVLEDGTNLMEHIASIAGKEKFRGFLICNVIKYITRYEKKNGVDDLKKGAGLCRKID